MRVALIVNPFATKVTDDGIAEVEAVLRRAGEVETLRTERPLHAGELARDADADAVVVFSGDGGFNEAVNGLRRDVPIGFLPGGGSSVLPRALGLPRTPGGAAAVVADALAAGRVRRISLGRVNGRRFAFSAGIGLDAEAVRRIDGRGRDESGRRPGDLAFVQTVAGILVERRGRYEPELEIAGVGRAAFALVSNGHPFTYVKGMPLQVAPDARFELGLDVTAVARLRPTGLARAIAYAATARARPEWVLRGHDLDRIEIRCDRPLPLQVDGEDLGDVAEAVFEAERGVLAVLA